MNRGRPRANSDHLQCSVCLEHKGMEDFYDPRRSTCKVCKKMQVTENRRKDPARYAEAARRRRSTQRLRSEIVSRIYYRLARAHLEDFDRIATEEAEVKGQSREVFWGNDAVSP